MAAIRERRREPDPDIGDAVLDSGDHDDERRVGGRRGITMGSRLDHGAKAAELLRDFAAAEIPAFVGSGPRRRRFETSLAHAAAPRKRNSNQRRRLERTSARIGSPRAEATFSV